jgi:hypothetical protein
VSGAFQGSGAISLPAVVTTSEWLILHPSLGIL